MQYTITKGLIGQARLHYKCPSCDNDLESPLPDAGQSDVCPLCQKQFVVPGTAELEARRAEEREKAELGRARQEAERKDREQRAREAEQVRLASIRDQAERKLRKNMVSQRGVEAAVDEVHSNTGVDVFLRLAFRFGRLMSAIILLCGFVAGIGCFVWLLGVRADTKPVKPVPAVEPDFPGAVDLQSAAERAASGQGAASTYARDTTQDTALVRQSSPEDEAKARYGSQIAEIVTAYRLPSGASEVLVAWIVELPPKYRDDFLPHLVEALNGLPKANSINYSYAVNMFHIKYLASLDAAREKEAVLRAQHDEAVRSNELAEIQASAQRKLLIMGIGISVGAVLCFLMLPLLIQIERNTRALLNQ